MLSSFYFSFKSAYMEKGLWDISMRCFKDFIVKHLINFIINNLLLTKTKLFKIIQMPFFTITLRLFYLVYTPYYLTVIKLSFSC